MAAARAPENQPSFFNHILTLFLLSGLNQSGISTSTNQLDVQNDLYQVNDSEHQRNL